MKVQMVEQFAKGTPLHRGRAALWTPSFCPQQSGLSTTMLHSLSVVLSAAAVSWLADCSLHHNIRALCSPPCSPCARPTYRKLWNMPNDRKEDLHKWGKFHVPEWEHLVLQRYCFSPPDHLWTQYNSTPNSILKRLCQNSQNKNSWGMGWICSAPIKMMNKVKISKNQRLFQEWAMGWLK